MAAGFIDPVENMESLPVLNPAVFALALAVAALGTGVRFANAGDQKYYGWPHRIISAGSL